MKIYLISLILFVFCVQWVRIEAAKIQKNIDDEIKADEIKAKNRERQVHLDELERLKDPYHKIIKHMVLYRWGSKDPSPRGEWYIHIHENYAKKWLKDVNCPIHIKDHWMVANVGNSDARMMVDFLRIGGFVEYDGLIAKNRKHKIDPRTLTSYLISRLDNIQRQMQKKYPNNRYLVGIRKDHYYVRSVKPLTATEKDDLIAEIQNWLHFSKEIIYDEDFPLPLYKEDYHTSDLYPPEIRRGLRKIQEGNNG